jgi:hypothetical protein
MWMGSACKRKRTYSPPGKLELGLFRYEPPDGVSETVHRLVLPWMDVRAGLYVQSGITYRTRMLLNPDDGEPTSRLSSVGTQR